MWSEKPRSVRGFFVGHDTPQPQQANPPHIRAHQVRQDSAKASVAVLFADLDHLKRVNDSLGHSTGDALIQGFTKRLKHGLRITDYCACIGGGEFTVVLESIHTLADATVLCDKLLAEIRQPFIIDGAAHLMTASFRLACHFDTTSTDAETLLKQADAMLYLAKHEGRDAYRIHPPAQGSKRSAVKSSHVRDHAPHVG